MTPRPKRRAGRPRRQPPDAVERIVTIGRLGRRGDGVGGEPPVYVPFALPGEEVRVRQSGVRGELVLLLSRSPRRAEPVCPHFGTCGGCALQHLAPEDYRAFKRDLVVAALAARGIAAEVEEPVVVPVASRRRAVFGAARRGGRLVFGFQRMRSHDLVDIATCPVLAPPLAARLPALRCLAEGLAGAGPLRLTVTAAANGIDVAASAAGGPPDDPGVVVEAAIAAGLARLTVEGDLLYQAAEPVLDIDGLAVPLPPGAFVQASAEAERAMQALVVAGVGSARHVADLFSGLGTFTLPLARRAEVHAVDGDPALLETLARASRTSTGRRPIGVERRDLFAFPLAPDELARFDAVVFDPPRAGALAQAEALARSRVGSVVAVSCNPATLARDLAVLRDGGYTVARVTPIDQFVFSAHIEVVAMLKRSAE